MEEETSTPREKTISISQLLLDTKNPRLPEVQTDQREAIRSMVRAQGDKVVALAKHIHENGPNPASLLIVMPAENDEGKYIVLDGNRRLTALKVLETPSLIEGVLDGKVLQRLRRMSSVFIRKPVTTLRCYIVESREEADTWIELIHRGYQSGAGLVEWDGQVAARYDARKGSKSAALQVLDFVKENADLSDETQQKIESGKFPITNLARLINTPYVREKLGIDFQADNVVTGFSSAEVIKGLTRVVEDLGRGRKTVSDIKSQSQRIDYINSLDQTELPQAEKALPTAQLLGTPESREGEGISLSIPKSVGRITPPIYRSALIPRDCKLRIPHHRIAKIFAELKRLDVADYPNAGAVMFRVFIELSVDYYLETAIKWDELKIDGSKLAQKLSAVANHFEKNKIMTTQQLAPVRKAASGQTLLAASVKSLHGYVHSKYMSPVASELKTAWEDLQPFLENIWHA